MRQIIVIVSILIISINTMAQMAETRLGFTLSPQISWLMSDHDRVSSNGVMAGYNFGLIIDHHFSTNYALSTGFLINTTGGKLDYKDGTNVTIGGTAYPDIHKLTYRLKYIDVPLGLKLITNQVNRNKFYLQMGLNSQFSIKTNDGNGKSINDEVRFYNIGYHLGGGTEYSLGGDLFLSVGLHFNSTFSDITSNKTYGDRTILRKFIVSTSLMF